MKKIIFLILLVTLSCKKEETSEPAPVGQTTTPAEKKYTFDYNYKGSDGKEYSGRSCTTESDMLNRQQLYGYYNIKKVGNKEC